MFTHHCTCPLAAYVLPVMLLLTSCASTPEPLSADKRQQLGKVYLNSAGPTGETFFHADFETGGTGGALRGAGKGAAKGLEDCLGSAIAGAQLAPLVFLICAPTRIPAVMMQGSRQGSVPVVPEETLAALEQQAVELLDNADLSPALVVAIDDLSQKNPALAAYEITHGILPLPEHNQSVNTIAAQWDYQTVMNVQVTRAGFESAKSQTPMLLFSMSAEITLYEAASGKLLDAQQYHYRSEPQPYALWFSNDYRNLVKEIARANKTLAGDIIGNVFMR